MGVCMSIRQVGEGFSLLAGRCHDNHKSLMQTPPLPESSSPLLSLCAVEDEREMLLFVPRGPKVTSPHRETCVLFESQRPPDVNLQDISCGQGAAQ